MAKRREFGLVGMVRVAVRVPKAHEDTLNYLADTGGLSVAEHVRRAVDLELKRWGAPVRIYVDERQGLEGRLVVTVTQLQRDLLKKWRGGNAADHIRRALGAYLPGAEAELERLLGFNPRTGEIHARAADTDTDTGYEIDEPDAPAPPPVKPAAPSPATLRPPRAPTPPRTKHPLAPAQVQGKHGPVTVPADPENPAAAADALRHQLGAPDPSRWDAKYRAKQ